MALSAILTMALTPIQKIADQQESINLEFMIPAKFGDWQIDKSIVPLQVAAETQAKLDKIYNQIRTITRITLAVKEIGTIKIASVKLRNTEVCCIRFK